MRGGAVVRMAGGASKEEELEPGFLAVLIVLGVVATLAWPRMVRRGRLAVQRFGVAPAIGWGLLALVAIPITALLFAITIIGLPVAVLILAVYAVGVIAAAVTAACVLGDWILSAAWAELRPGPVWLVGAVLIGSVLLWLVCSIDLIGPILWLVAIAWGFGIVGSVLLNGAAPDDGVIDLEAEQVG